MNCGVGWNSQALANPAPRGSVTRPLSAPGLCLAPRGHARPWAWGDRGSQGSALRPPQPVKLRTKGAGPESGEFSRPRERAFALSIQRRKLRGPQEACGDGIQAGTRVPPALRGNQLGISPWTHGALLRAPLPCAGRREAWLDSRLKREHRRVSDPCSLHRRPPPPQHRSLCRPTPEYRKGLNSPSENVQAPPAKAAKFDKQRLLG